MSRWGASDTMTAQFEIAAADLDLTGRACNWITAFHPDITIALDGKTAILESAEQDDAMLERVWHAVVLNERLHKRNEAARTTVLGYLLE